MKTPEQSAEIRDQIKDDNLHALMFDGCDAALLGPCRQHGGHTLALYSYTALVEVFVQQLKDADDPYTAALEWVETNVVSASMGPMTPVILYDYADA